ncbi:helicase domain protein [Bacteroides ovatus]|jgi:helicase C-terminal domain protein|uniref:helicase-related protein n=1 Tax=Bacteroides TaxID=816 RepID=UPI000E993242|nr:MULTISPECIES: helicase-related protein [Bacteroides]MCS3176114.1 helicase-related protein [Candidatus Bacteroides intestinigallinarum]RGN56376.1 helicase [Bacteroides sp. OM05-10AA]RGQ61190.1 helicase [Bacteroides sp. AF27-33]CAG9900366.1 helicase domain protein [Bacteroides ovatus]
MARIYDNIETMFTPGLQGIISNVGVKRVDFCVGYFNLRGWKVIVNEIDNLQGDWIYEKKNGNDERVLRTCRLLIGMHRPPDELIREMYSTINNNLIDTEAVKKCKRQIANEFRKQLTIGVPTANDEWTLRRLSAQMKEECVAVKLYLKEPLHAKLYLAHRPDDHFNKIQAIMGSSNLTYGGLSGQGELNAEFGDSDSAEKFATWFNDRWEDRYCVDITKELVEIIDESWASVNTIPPYYIYLKTAYHLSQEARSGINEYELPTEFKEDLFEFQETAVKLAARHLDKRGGAMIGDVVGLGKTITACAIAKVYEMRNSCSTLIICPANLQEMWKKYVIKYDLKADIISISKRLDYKQMKYYRLVIVDESHNLRNNNGARYRNIRELIEYHGSKVLLLTATPYNKDFSDLSNQLKLFIREDADLGVQPEEYIRSLGGAREFSMRHSEDFIRSIKAFERSTSADDWRELMRLFLVRRTRTFIKDNYAPLDNDRNRRYLQFRDGTRSYFPERLPKAIKFPTVEGDQFSRLYSAEMIDLMSGLRLPRYGLSRYISDKKQSEASEVEKQILDNLSRAGARMMGFCRTNFFKRLDSSGVSFLISLYRHILRNAIFLYAIENKLPLPIGEEGSLPDGYSEDDDEGNTLFESTISETQKRVKDAISFCDDHDEYLKLGERYYKKISADNRSNVSWINSQFFTRTLKQTLKQDCDTLIAMIKLCGAWQPKEDQKLNALVDLITKTHNGEKVIVFTQFSDTASYLESQLVARKITNVGCVTGNTANPTQIVEQFSPISNKVEHPLPIEQQYRVLIATDVLSEGQNLQDSHIVINYDLPWAIIRLIQRAGRVDRIGQSAEEIFCYSFFPADGIESIIRLRHRLNNRINESANVVGGDEIFFEGNEQNLTDIYNEKNGVLDEEEEGEIDLASQAFQIWKSATEANPILKKIIPSLSNVVYSTKANTHGMLKEGVITYAKTPEGNDMLTWMDKKMKVVTQSQQTILKALSCSMDESPVKALDSHHEIVSRSISMMQQQEVRTSGILGSRFSTKYRLYTLLDGYCKNEQGSLFFKDEIKLATDDIYNYPLYENAKYILGQQLKRGARIDDIVDMVIELRKNDELCIINEDEAMQRDPQIICSMGLSNVL